jgi:pyridoxal 5'-phosphate synthase pdxT subunit
MQPGLQQPDNQSASTTSASSSSSSPSMSTSLTIGVLALQGAFVEHISLLQRAAAALAQQNAPLLAETSLHFIEVRTPAELAACTALILPGGESTAISLIAERGGLLEPLREFVKVQRKPVWGTCAGLILLAESANKSKSTGQELIGGLDVRVQRNYFGRQVESFEAGLKLAFLEGQEPFHSVFIRAPVVEKVLSAGELAAVGGETVNAPAKKATKAQVEILGRLPGRAKTLRDQTTTAEDLGEDGDIVAVRQGNVFGTAFHPELTGDERIHSWWLQEVLKASRES